MPGPRLELKTSVVPAVLIGVIAAMVLVTWFVLGGIAGKLVASGLGVGYGALCVGLGKRRLILDDEGVTVRRLTGTTTVAWTEVDHYTYWSIDHQMYAAAGAGGGGVLVAIAIVAIVKAFRKTPANRQFTMGRLTLIARDGRKIVVDTRYRKVAEALDRAFAELHPRLRTQPLDFAPFALTDTELRHAKKGALGLADIDKIGAGNAKLAIRRRGKRLAWVSVPMKRVKNVMLLVEELAERGLVIDAKSDVFVPPPVLAKLRAATARQAALPAAKIVQR